MPLEGGLKMGMSIEEIIQELERTKDYPANDPASDEALDGAIATMRKYQKITEIAFPLQFCSTDKLEHEAIMKICEVLENENEGC